MDNVARISTWRVDYYRGFIGVWGEMKQIFLKSSMIFYILAVGLGPISKNVF